MVRKTKTSKTVKKTTARKPSAKKKAPAKKTIKKSTDAPKLPRKPADNKNVGRYPVNREENRKGGRYWKSNLTEETLQKLEVLYEELAKYPNISEACKKAGLCRFNIVKLRKEFSMVRERFNEAYKIGISAVEDLQVAMAFGKTKKGNFQAVRHILKAHNRKKYGDYKPAESPIRISTTVPEEDEDTGTDMVSMGRGKLYQDIVVKLGIKFVMPKQND